MAYNPLPLPNWYAVNPRPVGSGQTFNPIIFRIGLRLSESQQYEVYGLLRRHLDLSGVTPDGPSRERIIKKRFSEAVGRVYDMQKSLYGWGDIKRDIVITYLKQGINFTWNSEEHHSEEHHWEGQTPLPEDPDSKDSKELEELRKERLAGRELPQSPGLTATPRKNSRIGVVRPDKDRDTSGFQSSSSPNAPQLSPPARPRKRTRGATDETVMNPSNSASATKRSRRELNTTAQSTSEQTVQQRLKNVRDQLCERQRQLVAELENIQRERTHVEGILADLAKEERTFSEAKGRVDESRVAAIAVLAAAQGSLAGLKM